MFRPIVCSIFLIAAATAAGVSQLNNIDVKVLTGDEITNFKNQRQGVKLIPIKGVKETSRRGFQDGTVIRYTLGNRITNDRLVSTLSDYFESGSPQDTQLRLQYPARGEGAVITSVEIIVNQSSDIGEAYAIDGGIGQRYIVIIVEAYNTRWFNYSAKVYGV